MRKFISIAILLLGCYTSYAQKNAEAEKKEDKAYEALEAVPEVQSMILHDTDKAWPLMMRTVATPSDRFKYYWIEVGHQSGQRFLAQYHFYILPPKMEVFYRDPLSDKLYTPKEWRAKGK